jgi:nitroreductase
MELNTAIKKRHSVRSFKTTKKAKWQDVVKAVDAANYSPSAGNIGTVRFILVSDSEKIAKITQSCQQGFIAKASHIVVVCSNLTQVKRAYKQRGEKYSKQQAGAAIQNFLLEITNLGLGACWVGAFHDSGIRETLDIPESVEVEAVIPVGYEMAKGKPRKKMELDSVLFFNKWNNTKMKPEKYAHPG